MSSNHKIITPQSACEPESTSQNLEKFVVRKENSCMNFKVDPISRKAFRVSACVDWLDVTIVLLRPTQFHHLRHAIEDVTGKKPWVEPLNKREDEGGIATIFQIRFRDDLANDLASINRVLENLKKKYPFATGPTISGIEVACDFWYKGHAARQFLDTQKMTYRLQSSLFASGSKPRQFDPKIGEKGDNRYMEEGTRLDPSLNFRIGHKLDCVSWQVYFKTVDEMKPLEQAKWRARVEVTLQGEALQDLGLNVLEDLQGYGFNRLTRFFRFRRPIEPARLANGDLYKLYAIQANRKIHDSTVERGIHSFTPIGRRDKWRKVRAESKHIEPDNELQDAVKGALRRLKL